MSMEVPLSPLEFARRARKLYPHREAVVDRGRRFSYAEFMDRCDRASAVLQKLGVGPGDRIVVISPNTHPMLESFYSIPQIGAIIVPLNYRLISEDFMYSIQHSGASVVCAHSDHLEAIDSIRDRLAEVRHFVAFEGARAGWLSYETLIQSFPLPASIHAVRLEPLRGIEVLVIEARLAFAMDELFFGGSSQKAMKVEGRDFTPIESRFLGKFVERMLRGMEESWQGVVPIKSRYLRSELNPYLLNAAGMGDAMILSTYSINMSPITGSVLFSLPLAAIEEYRNQLKSGVPMGDDPENIGIFRRAQEPLLGIEVEVKAVVDVVHMSVGEIMAVRPGDVIQLNATGLDQVELWIEGKRKFLGKAAQRNGNKVFIASGRTE